MKLKSIAVFLCCCAPVLAAPLNHIRISTPNASVVAVRFTDLGYDVLEGSIARGAFDVIVSKAELERLRAEGWQTQVVAVGRPFREIQKERGGPDGPGVPPGYPDLNAVLAAMNAAAAAFPSICQVVDLTTTYGVAPTFENRHMFAVKISDNVAQDEDEPAYLVVSDHHAREIVTPVIALHAIDQFTTQYGNDPVIQGLVNSHEIWIAPVWNPDGYEHVFNVENLWRKNRRDFGASGVGVDQNRNYPFGWTAACSGSTNVSSGTYKGPSAASEAETQTMIAWSQDRHFAKVLDFHSSGRITLFAYGCSPHPLGSFLQQEAVDISTASGYGGAVRPPSAEGEHYEWQLATRGAHAFLTETHTTFQPDFTSAQAEATQVFPSLIWQLQRAIPLGGHVTDASTGQPLVANIGLPGVNFQNGETNSSESRFGRYHVFAPSGPLEVEFSAPGYVTQTHLVNFTASTAQALDVALVPAALNIQLVSGPAALEPPNTAPGVTVEITPAGQNLVPGSPTLFHRYDGGTFLTTPLAPVGGDLFAAALPVLQCGDLPEYYASAQGDGGTTVTLPPTAPAGVLGFGVGDLVTLFHDDFETDTGWTAENLGATSGDWQRDVPINDPSWAYDPISDSDGSGRCYVTDNGPGNTDVDAGAVRLTSPMLDMSAGNVTIAYDYYLRLTDTTGGVDRLLVEIDENGGAGPWIEVARHDTDGGLDWRHHEIDSAALAGLGVTLTSTMRLRFTANDANPQSIVEAGIDAFLVATSGCAGVTCTKGDVNNDGVINAIDVQFFVDALVLGAAPGTVPFCAADMDGDGVLESGDDVALFVGCLISGTCP